MQRIEPYAINQFRRFVDVPDGEICPLSSLKRANVVKATKCTCGLTGNAGNALPHRHAKQCGGHIHGQQQ
ncbi:N-formimino-L-glutamate deiminase [compost metagenome]